ncbi:flagellar hook-associated protein FlgL [Paucidesulfovibrio longus]|uniref:flagellar hook-associated protein FlgL n=1 Tax=Paucidesulfovibrio longus TaxID=889 RepID=UPI0003B443CC|nr:flagellar hook-associated protein FlgL [Paucidesulfovibrio longus]
MRVSQQMLYAHYVTNMNASLTNLMDLNVKAQSQKRIIRPSDDPVGMERVLDHRDAIRTLGQYKENISTAKGWLGRSDSTLTQVSALITRAKTLAEQGATGTYDEQNREQISYELRSIFDQLVEMSNMEFEDKSIYAGHKTDSNAFEKVLWMTTNDPDLNADTTFSVEGNSDRTVLVQYFDTTGATAVGDTVSFDSGNVGVRYSIDGGKTFLTDGTVSNVVGGQVRVNLPQSGASVVYSGVDAGEGVKANHLTDTSDASGTWAWLRPSALYLGDDMDAIRVDSMGEGVQNITATAAGSFNANNTVVRIDNDTAVGMDEVIEYSYSLDGGASWVTGNTTSADLTSNQALITIPPGGMLTLASNGGNQLQPGAQFVITPRAASVNVNISVSETVRLNDVGKDIFGGLYQDPDLVRANGGSKLSVNSANTSVVFDNGSGASTLNTSNAGYTKNLFETVGNLVAFLETNNQSGVQRCLESLDRSQQQILTAAASVGGRENRLTVAEGLVDNLKLNEQARMSSIEDADVAELMTQISQGQIVYESVLRSTSLIMNMNLMKFI